MQSCSVRGQINEKFYTLKPPPSPSKAPPKSANIAQRHSAREGVQSSSTDQTRRSLDLARNIPETTPSSAVCPRRCSLDLQKNPAGSANTAGRLCLSTRPTPLDMSPLKLPSSRPSSAASSPSFKPDSPCRIQYEKREGNNGWKILGARYKKAHANCSKENFQNNSTESPTSSEFLLTNLQALGAQLQHGAAAPDLPQFQSHLHHLCMYMLVTVICCVLYCV